MALPGSRSKRLCSLPPTYNLQEAEPAAIVQDIQSSAVPGMVQLNLGALTSTTPAAPHSGEGHMATEHQVSVPSSATTALGQVEHLVNKETLNLTQPTGLQGTGPPFSTLSVGDEPCQLFTSISVDLGARVSSKTKAKM